jgi:hypothetical protein
MLYIFNHVNYIDGSRKSDDWTSLMAQRFPSRVKKTAKTLASLRRWHAGQCGSLSRGISFVRRTDVS